MDAPITDLLMMFSLDGTNGLAAGSTASIDTSVTLNKGFAAGKFFELESFQLGMRLDSGESQAGDPAAAHADERDFAAWRSAKAGASEPALPYRCKPEAFSVTRQMDSASPVLFGYCATRTSLKKAVVLKRGGISKDQGGGGAKPSADAEPGTLTFLPFLRLEFDDVLLTSMDWSDGDVVVETCRFTFKKLQVTYVKRGADGAALGAGANGGSVSCTWSAQAGT